MAVPHESWSISGIDTSGHARVHIGHHNEYHDHRYGDESQLSHAELQRAREDAIMSSLYFTDMSARERAIDSPCNDTFNWIFDEQVTEWNHWRKEHVCNLMSRWLEHEHGMFFIVGKAGSGKSTLMRFLVGHKKTRTLLHSWAEQHGCTLTICAHYFWCSGSQLQSSQEGLWRSILYAIAKEDRKLASAMFAKRAGDDCKTLAQLRSQPWARNELISTLSLLVARLKVQKVAVCLFIDGLDEYQGDEMMLITEPRHLLGSPYIKICASSRPRSLFEEAFGHEDYQWKLALHLLTRGDMVQLARTRLCEDEAFCKLVDRGDRRQDFVTAITAKSQGVFLWTVLVVREMTREAHQAGTIDELKVRLDALPIELGGEKGMYQRIVERSDPRYRKYMARLLLVMLEAGKYDVQWQDVHFLYYDERDAAFATRECLGLDDKYRLAWDEKTEEAAIQPPQSKFDSIDGTSCRGLFLACYQECSGAHPRGVNCQVHDTSLKEDTRRRLRKWCPDFVDTNDKMSPQFLHRSVEEYLSLPEIRKEMFDLAGQGFDPVLTRCHLRLAHLRLQSYLSGPVALVYTFFVMIACLRHEQRDLVRKILSKLEGIQVMNVEGSQNCVLSVWLGGNMLSGGFDISRSSQAHAWFLSLVAVKGLVWYCRERWSHVPTSDRQATGTIIIAGLLFWADIQATVRERIDLTQCLLRSGVNPNTRYGWIAGHPSDGRDRQLSIWEAYVETFPEIWASTSETDVSRALEMMQLLLHEGRADKQCCLPAGEKSLLSALMFEPHANAEARNHQNHNWSMFAGRLRVLLDAHGLLTPKERHIALEQGWILQSATEPHLRRFSRWLRKLKR
jgi:hypothetical protein